MPFTEYLMKPGSWEVSLDPNTPRYIRDALGLDSKAFSLLVVTPAHADADAFGDAGLLDNARYVGVYRSLTDSGLTLGGAGLVTFLGDEDGKGDIIESAVSTAGGTLTQWFAALLPYMFTSGTLTDPGGTYTRSFRYVTRREAWDRLAQRFGVEYRVNTDLTFDVGPKANLYGTSVSTVVLGESSGIHAGRDLGIVGIAGAFNVDTDVEDLTTKVIYLAGDPATAYTAGGDSVVHRAPDGDFMRLDRLIDAAADDSASPSAMATAQLGRFDDPRFEWTVDGRGCCDIGARSPVGSNLYLYDPDTGLVDDGNPVYYRGTQIYPVTSRLVGLETPIRSGMGVYLRTATGSSTREWIDLTPYVRPETGAQRITVGALPRPSR